MRCRPWSKGAAGPGARRQGARWRCRRRSSAHRALPAGGWGARHAGHVGRRRSPGRRSRRRSCGRRETCGRSLLRRVSPCGRRARPARGARLRRDDPRRDRSDLGGAPRIARFRAYADGDAWGEGRIRRSRRRAASGCMWRWSRPAATRPSRAWCRPRGGHPQWRLALPAGDAAAAFALSGREERHNTQAPPPPTSQAAESRRSRRHPLQLRRRPQPSRSSSLSNRARTSSRMARTSARAGPWGPAAASPPAAGPARPGRPRRTHGDEQVRMGCQLRREPLRPDGAQVEPTSSRAVTTSGGRAPPARSQPISRGPGPDPRAG